MQHPPLRSKRAEWYVFALSVSSVSFSNEHLTWHWLVLWYYFSYCVQQAKTQKRTEGKSLFLERSNLQWPFRSNAAKKFEFEWAVNDSSRKV